MDLQSPKNPFRATSAIGQYNAFGGVPVLNNAVWLGLVLFEQLICSFGGLCDAARDGSTSPVEMSWHRYQRLPATSRAFVTRSMVGCYVFSYSYSYTHRSWPSHISHGTLFVREHALQLGVVVLFGGFQLKPSPPCGFRRSKSQMGEPWVRRAGVNDRRGAQLGSAVGKWHPSATPSPPHTLRTRPEKTKLDRPIEGGRVLN